MADKIIPTEDQITETIDRIAVRLSKKFRFGYHTVDDIKQEIAVLCLEVLRKYDGVRPLENFLWTHTKNRLCNFKRDKYERRDQPCITCPLYDKLCVSSKSQCMKFENKLDCPDYSQWLHRNEKKKSLVNSSVETVANLSEGKYEDNTEQMDAKKIIDLLDKHIPMSMREDYVKFKYNIRLNRIRQATIVEEIRRICEEHGVTNAYCA